MYWGIFIALNSTTNLCLEPKIEFFFKKGGWVIKIDEVSYQKNDLTKQNLSKNKTLKIYQYIRFKKTFYGTEIIENRITLDSPWYVAGETRGKIKVINDLKGIVKIKENHQTRVQHLETGKSITSNYPIKEKLIKDRYLILWSKKPASEKTFPLLYGLPDMNLIEIKERTQHTVFPQVVEL